MVKMIRANQHSSNPWFALVIVAATAIVAGVYFLSRPRRDPEKLWAEAQTELKAGRGDKAEALVEEIGKLRPPTPLDEMLKAQIAIAGGRVDEALGHLEKVPDNHQMGAQARLLAGQLELRRKRPRLAEGFLLKAVELDPDLVQARRELVYIYGILLRREGLREQFQALSDISVLTFKDVFVWCLTRSSIWEPIKNTAPLREYVEKDPEDRWSRLALAENLRQLNRRDEAEKVLEPLPNTDADALLIRVRIALDRNQDEESIQALLKQGPDDNAELSRIRGKFALAHKRGEEAIRHYRLAFERDPDQRDGQVGMAQALTMVGDEKAAAPFAKRARDLEQLTTLVQRAAATDARNDIPLIKSLGAACEQVGRIPEAKAWYTLALNTNPLDAEAQKAIFRLKKTNIADTGRESAEPRSKP